MLRALIISTLVGAAFALAVRLLLPRALARRGVWLCWHTRFGPALVFDSADEDGTCVRLLNVNGTYQSVCYVDDDLLWVPVCAYHRLWGREVRRRFGPAPAVGGSAADAPAPTDSAAAGPQSASEAAAHEPMLAARRALVMGGGGYSFPKWLVAYRPDFSCEAVEIDPVIMDIARERFFVDRLVEEFDTQVTGRLDLVEADAWDYLLCDGEGYDLIVNDAFGGNRPLGRLGGAEGAAAIRAHLREGGLYIGNVRTPLEGRRARALVETREAFEAEFSHVRVIPERPEEPRKVGNNTLLAW